MIAQLHRRQKLALPRFVQNLSARGALVVRNVPTAAPDDDVSAGTQVLESRECQVRVRKIFGIYTFLRPPYPLCNIIQTVNHRNFWYPA